MIMQSWKRHVWRFALASVVPLLLIAGSLLLIRTSSKVLASPPVEGNSLSFGMATAVFTPTQDVTTLALTYLDGDAFPDLVFAVEGEVRIAANTGLTFTGWLTPVSVAGGLGRINDLFAADLDRDARIDLVAISGDRAGGRIQLWRNPGDPFNTTWSEGGVLTQSTILAYSVGAVGDLDGDAAPDLIVGSSDGLLRFWRNPMGPGDAFSAEWGAPVEFTIAAGPPKAIQVADLNGDGHLDLLVVVGNSLQILESPGNPFGAPWGTCVSLSGLGHDLHSLFVTDLDGDGRPDPVAGDAAGNLLAWSNPLTPGLSCSGEWPAPVVVGMIGEPLVSLSGGDFDHNGWVDLAGGGGGPTYIVRAWHNRGGLSGLWDALTLGARADAVHSLEAADADTDGDLDLLAGSGAGDVAQVVLWPNTLTHRDAPFPEIVLPVGESAADVKAVVRGDLDRDGWPDLVSGNASGEIVIWENGGNPMQAAWAGHVVGHAQALLSLALADLDGDGDLEIVSGHRFPPHLLVWQNQTTSLDGPWISSEVGDPGAGVGGLGVADLDLDGWLDLVSGTGIQSDDPNPAHRITVWHNDGTPFDNSWAFMDAAVISYTVNAVAVGDLNLDGWPDIAIGTSRAPAVGRTSNPIPRAQWPNAFQVHVLRNPRTPFSNTWPVTAVGRDPATVTLGPEDDPSHYHGYWGATVHDIELVDFDRDGDLDIVTADHIEADYQVKVWENDSTPFDGQPETFHWTWQPVAVWCYPPPASPWMGGSALTVDVADFNMDGWPDVVPGISGWVRLWFENNRLPFGTHITDTHWLPHFIALNSTHVQDIAIGDYDRDGDPDIASGSNLVAGSEVTLWPNQGGAVAQVARATGLSPMQQNTTDDLLRIQVTHHGYAGADDVRLVRWRVRFTNPGGSPLTSEEARAVVGTLWIYRDTGNGRWSTADTPVINMPDLTLDESGYQTLAFDVGGPLPVVSGDSAATFFVVVEIPDGAMYQTPNAFQLWFDADADSLVRKVTNGASVAVDDSEPVGSGLIQIVGPPTHVLIEDAPAGTGSNTGDAVVASGYTLDFYAISRDELEQYVAPRSVTWALTPLGGGVVPEDLVASPDGTWARLHAHQTGTAVITIEHPALGTDATGAVIVGPAPAQMSLSAEPSELVVGDVVTVTLRASLLDADGAPVVDGVPITFTIVSGSELGGLPASPYVAPTVSGEATTIFTAGSQPGQVIISAATAGLEEHVSITLKPHEMFLPLAVREG